MKFLIDGKIVEAPGIRVNGELITSGMKGAVSKFIDDSLVKLKDDFNAEYKRMNGTEFKELLEPL